MVFSFLPTTKAELKQKVWHSCDIILITGDAYIDHPSFGASMIGRYLESLGYKVGIIAQPDWNSDDDFLKLGTPKLFVGITAGNIDSMLAHYTANKKLRTDDDYTPGNVHGKRPNRATIVYSNKVKQLMPGIPIVIGGVEASMRRLAHFDYWSETIRKSILLDTKADILVYGMGENQIAEIAQRIKNIESLDNIPGTAIYKTENSYKPDDFKDSIVLPDFVEISKNTEAFLKMTRLIEENLNPYCAKTLIQKYEGKYVIINPPAMPLTFRQMDNLYSLQFMRQPHPSYKEPIPAFEMIKDSITILRGCAGGCAFCSLGLHQGKLIQSRSISSVVNEVKHLIQSKNFKGTISDLGGPTANLYSLGCTNIEKMKTCKRPSCLHPSICKNFNTKASSLINLMKSVRKLSGIKKVNISSGVRFDVALKDHEYVKELVNNHIPGHLKLAPEHFNDEVLNLMRKPPLRIYNQFSDLFKKLSVQKKKHQYILPYLISGFPGCSGKEAQEAAEYLKKNKIKVEQVQDFIPLPMTIATAMYYTGKDPYSGKKLYIEKGAKERKLQKQSLLWWKR